MSEATRAGTLVLRDGRVVEASEGLAALAARPVAELVGGAALDLLVPEDRPRLAELAARAARGELVPATIEVSLLLPDGGRRPVEWHMDGAEGVVHVRDRAQDAPHRELVAALAEIGAGLRAERSVEGVHTRLREELGRLGAVSALIRAVEGRSCIVWSVSAAPLRGEFAALAGASPEGFAGPMSPFARRVLAEGCAFTDDWATHAPGFLPGADPARARELVERAGFSRTIAVRIDAPGEDALWLAIASPVLRSDDVPAIRLFGAQFSAALAAARTIADLSRRNAHLAVLARVAELAGEITDLPAFFAKAAEVVRPVAGFVGCAIFVVDEATGDLVRVHLDPTGPPALDAPTRRIPLSTPLGQAVRTRVARVTGVPYPGATPEIVAALPFPAMAWVPLVARSRGVGALAAAFDSDVETASASLELLSSVGAHFASAIESHQLLGALRRRVEEQTLLLDVARASAQLDAGLVLETALRRVCATAAADVAAAWVREDGRLVLQSSVGLEAGGVEALRVLELGGNAPGLAVERRAVVRATAGDALGPHLPGGCCAPLAAAIAVPLVAKADAVGALLLLRGEGEAPFGDGDAALLTSVGAQLGVALDSARLFADVRRRLADLEAVHALTLRVFANAPGDVGALLQDACRELRRALAAEGAAVYLADDQGATLRAAASDGLRPPVEALVIDLRAGGLAAEVMRSRAPLQTEDVTREPRSALRGRADVPPLALLAIPLVGRRDVRGIVFVADHGGRRFGPGDLAVANALAGALGVGVENADLYADARRRVEDLSALNEAGRAIAGSLDLDEVRRQATEAARRVAGAPRAFLVRQDPDTRALTFAAGAGVDRAAFEGLLGPIPEGTVLARVLRDRQAVAIEDTASGDPVYLRRFGGRALVAVPVLLRGEALGVLVVDDPAGPRTFSAPDLERLTTVADQLAVASENARLFLETRRRAEELGLLHEVGRSLVQSLEVEEVLSRGVQSIARIVGAPAAYLALATPDGAALELRAWTGDADAAARVGRTMPLGRPSPTIAPLVYERGEPVLVDDAATDPRVSDDMRRLTGARAYLGLPLVVHDRAIGTVVIVETRGPRRFTPAEVERATGVANQLAVAAENARLYDDLRRSYAELARAQQQLVQGERLAALGEMSAVVAHEVRNPLGVIFNSVGSLRRLVRPTGDAKMLFDIVEEEADRLNRIVGDLLDFARPSTPELRPELLGRVAEDAAEAAVAAVASQGERIELVSELEAALPPVRMDARLVRQAFLNVAVNAVQAMPRGGRLTVRARRDGDRALVEFEDTGTGIPDEVRERMFEPFFTTKASGTGLGLAVVRRIVEGHGGEVRVRSAPGAGTTFSLRFPLDAGAVENPPAMR